MKSPQRHSSQRGSDIHFVEAQAYCLPMELASLLRVTFGLVLLVSQSLMQQALHHRVFVSFLTQREYVSCCCHSDATQGICPSTLCHSHFNVARRDMPPPHH